MPKHVSGGGEIEQGIVGPVGERVLEQPTAMPSTMKATVNTSTILEILLLAAAVLLLISQVAKR
jgi:hypothetical protein